MNSFKLQMYTPEHLRQVCTLQTHLWGPSVRRNAAILKWKYLCNPYIEEPLIYLALHENSVVGMRAMFGTCWEAGGRGHPWILPSAADTLLDPKHRDSGLFQDLSGSAIEDMRKRGFSHILNLSSSDAHYVVQIMTMGWKPLGASGSLYRRTANPAVIREASEVANRSRLLRRAVDAGKKAGRQFRAAMSVNPFTVLDRHAQDNQCPTCVAKKPKPRAMAELVERAGRDGRIRHVRDKTYFSWRYHNPMAQYRFLFYGSDTLEGYLVLQNIIGKQEINIVDWEGRNDRVRSELLTSAVQWGNFRTMCIWGRSLSSASLETVREAGFAEDSSNGYKGCFLIKPLKEGSSVDHFSGCDPMEPDQWDMRMIYSDGA